LLWIKNGRLFFHFFKHFLGHIHHWRQGLVVGRDGRFGSNQRATRKS
jgi:hypothetical protein